MQASAMSQIRMHLERVFGDRTMVVVVRFTRRKQLEIKPWVLPGTQYQCEAPEPISAIDYHQAWRN